MLDGRVLGASQVEYKPFGKPPLKREVEEVGLVQELQDRAVAYRLRHLLEPVPALVGPRPRSARCAACHG